MCLCIHVKWWAAAAAAAAAHSQHETSYEINEKNRLAANVTPKTRYLFQAQTVKTPMRVWPYLSIISWIFECLGWTPRSEPFFALILIGRFDQHGSCMTNWTHNLRIWLTKMFTSFMGWRALGKMRLFRRRTYLFAWLKRTLNTMDCDDGCGAYKSVKRTRSKAAAISKCSDLHTAEQTRISDSYLCYYYVSVYNSQQHVGHFVIELTCRELCEALFQLHILWNFLRLFLGSLVTERCLVLWFHFARLNTVK